ncbi:MAG: hypothetical protein QOH93_3345 [Chloroflexia bacterium]|jgi:hypothetical protein|nr:hypothetical protein [Chloroflexia bacterium]
MRCPNCGNENPPDYVFCDECGARLQGGEDTGIAAQGAGATDQAQAGGAVPVGVGGQAQQGYAADGGYGSSQGGQGQSPAGQYDGAQAGQVGNTGGMSGDGESTVGADGGQASWDAQGSAGAGMDSGGISGGLDGDAAYGASQQATQATYGEDKGFGAGPSATSAQGITADADYGAGQDAEAVAPVTEDTIQAGGSQPGGDDSDSYAPAAQVGGDQGGTMPGVMEIENGGVQDDHATAGYAAAASGETYSDAGTGASTQASGGGQGAWASQAVHLLDQAQSAMGRGDWAAFGSGMSELRAFLTGLGATTGTGAWTAGSAEATSVASTSGASQPSTSAASQSGGFAGGDAAAGQASTYGGYNEPAYSGGATQGNGAAAPSLEPQAEAGTLDEQPDTGTGASYEAAGDGGAGATQDAGIAADAGGDQAAADAGAGAGVGMMSQGASQAAVGGVGASPNGAVENMMARLVIISTGAELPLPEQEEIMVGREDPSSGIFPDVDLTPYGGEEGGVSRRHARLLHINGDYFVEDLQSTNFTKLDGQRLPAHVRERLEDGARIDFGRVATIFRRS